MRIFIALHSLNPGYGGPAFSVTGLAVALASVGIDVAVWAADHSSPDRSLRPNSRVSWVSGKIGAAMAEFGKVDLIHDNGIWRLHNHRLSRISRFYGIRRIVSPRGMLEPWSLRHKKWKKKIALGLYQMRDLASAHLLHATADTEACGFRALGLTNPICIIPNGVNVSPPRDVSVRDGDIKTALFMSRIHPKKGLPLLIDAWATVRPSGWRLMIAGPDEAGHLSEVKRGVSAAKLENSVIFAGPLFSDAKEEAFRTADLFVLPSYSENFGVVVAEAMAHGVPVLTTTGTPWSILPQKGAGWCVDPTVDGLIYGLKEATACTSERLRNMGAAGRDLAIHEYGWSSIAARFITAYEEVLSGRSYASRRK